MIKRAGTMVAFDEELRLAEPADINARRLLPWQFVADGARPIRDRTEAGAMFVVEPASVAADVRRKARRSASWPRRALVLSSSRRLELP